MAPSERTRLVGWKQISAYLDVTEKTARNWELERGLPVRRQGQGKKRPVVAYTNELDAWRARDEQPSDRRPARRLATRAGALAAAVIALVWGGWAFLADPGRPSRLEVHSSGFQVLDDEGHSLWQHSFEPLDPAAYKKQEELVGERWMLLDLDGDDQDEILFMEISASYPEDTSVLHCFRQGGQPCWSPFSISKTLPEDPRLGDTLRASILGIVSGPSQQYLAIYGLSATLYASCVFLLDPLTGQSMQDYCHPGFFYDIRILDLDQDGDSELVCGGINNPGPGLGYPALAVLTVPFGQARGPGYFEQPYGPLQYVLLPRPAVADVTKEKFAVWEVTSRAPEGLRVRVQSGLLLTAYDLNPSLEITEVMPGDELRTAHAKLFLSRALDHPFDDDLDALRHVERFDAAPDANGEEVRRLFAP